MAPLRQRKPAADASADEGTQHAAGTGSDTAAGPSSGPDGTSRHSPGAAWCGDACGPVVASDPLSLSQPLASSHWAGRQRPYAEAIQGQHWAIKLAQYVSVLAALALVANWALWLRDSKGLVFTKEVLALYRGESGQSIYIAILGEVFDVSSKAATYGPGKGYHHFAGRDASRAFITGKFQEDLVDDVADFTPEQCLGLVEWREFYHKTYKYKGRVAGAFFDSNGQATQARAHIETSAVRGKAVREAQAKEKDKWPSCSMRYTQDEGGTVWCDDGLYPRKLFVEMEGGQPSWRCACFKELGWSDLRQVYPDCSPEAHKCQVSPPTA